MKAFNKWYETFQYKSFIVKVHRACGWVGALAWVLENIDFSDSPESLQAKIKNEIEVISSEL